MGNREKRTDENQKQFFKFLFRKFCFLVDWKVKESYKQWELQNYKVPTSEDPKKIHFKASRKNRKDQLYKKWIWKRNPEC